MCGRSRVLVGKDGASTDVDGVSFSKKRGNLSVFPYGECLLARDLGEVDLDPLGWESVSGALRSEQGAEEEDAKKAGALELSPCSGGAPRSLLVETTPYRIQLRQTGPA